MPVRRIPRLGVTHILSNDIFLAKVFSETDFFSRSTITYARIKDGGRRLAWSRLTPDNAEIVLVSEPCEAPNIESGKDIARGTLHRLANGEIDYTLTPFVAPLKAKRVAELEHSTKVIRASVVKWPTEYEVFVIGYVKNGYALPVGSPSITQDRDYEWGRLIWNERILADTEEEAFITAREEMDRCWSEEIPFKKLDQ